ncbi:hypothetical protein NLG97_g2760 [Lecanicillium saksenae]|uniref:Uncharacterized protein n=1 Tax=Lecanicillium saksenae TaxID=468837 RepID=A0ACC1R1R6_9HYPO|nr:hypothetical protein NLG97_g2760 [Lecanicillium saksenae]
MDAFDNLTYRQALEAQLDELQKAQTELKGKGRAGEPSDYDVFLEEQVRMLGHAIQSCHGHEHTRRYADHCEAVRHAPPCLQPGVTPRTSLDRPSHARPSLAKASPAKSSPTRSSPTRSSPGRTSRVRTSLARPSLVPLPPSRKKKHKTSKSRPWYKRIRGRFRLFWMFQLSVDYGTKIRQAAAYTHRLPPCTMVEDPILPSSSKAPLHATPSSSKYPRNSTPAKKSPADKKPADDRGLPICDICYEPHDRGRLTYAPCRHVYCPDCLCNLFETAATVESRYPPHCCTQEILLETAIKWLPAKLLRLFKAKQVEYATENRLYCSNKFCFQFIPPSKISGGDGYCEKCGRLTCERCKNEAHTGKCTMSSSQPPEFQYLEEEYGYKRCHKCNQLLSISYGCNHMECVCGAHLCYSCGMEWKTCDCPYADENLVTRQSTINPLPRHNNRIDEQAGTITAIHDKAYALVNDCLATVQSVGGKLSSLDARLMLLLGLCVILMGLYLFLGVGAISRRWAIILQAVSGKKTSSFSISFDRPTFGGASWRQPEASSWARWWKRTAS